METTVAEIFCERSDKTHAHHWHSALFNPGLLEDFLLVFGNLGDHMKSVVLSILHFLERTQTIS